MNIREKGFIHKYYLLCGIIGCSITVINMIMLTLMKNGILRLEYHLFYWVILPNAIAKILLSVWVLHYCYTLTYKRDINIFARDILMVIIANILVIAFDETTMLYYIAQAIPCLIIFIFMLVIVIRLRDALQTNNYMGKVYFINTLLYILMVLQVFIAAISFSNYDPYLVSFVGLSYFGLLIGMIQINKLEKTARLAVAEETGGSMKPRGDSEFDFEDDEDFDETEDEFY